MNSTVLAKLPSTDKMVLLMKRINDFHDDNQYTMGELNLFSSANRDDVNQKAVGHLLDLMKSLVDNPQRRYLTLSDLFQLQFRIVENDNDTGWVDKLSHVGPETSCLSTLRPPHTTFLTIATPICLARTASHRPWLIL